MYFLNGLVTPPQEGWLEVNTKSSRVRAIGMSSATQKTTGLYQSQKETDGHGMEQLEFFRLEFKLSFPSFFGVKK